MDLKNIYLPDLWPALYLIDSVPIGELESIVMESAESKRFEFEHGWDIVSGTSTKYSGEANGVIVSEKRSYDNPSDTRWFKTLTFTKRYLEGVDEKISPPIITLSEQLINSAKRNQLDLNQDGIIKKIEEAVSTTISLELEVNQKLDVKGYVSRIRLNPSPTFTFPKLKKGSLGNLWHIFSPDSDRVGVGYGIIDFLEPDYCHKDLHYTKPEYLTDLLNPFYSGFRESYIPPKYMIDDLRNFLGEISRRVNDYTLFRYDLPDDNNKKVLYDFISDLISARAKGGIFCEHACGSGHTLERIYRSKMFKKVIGTDLSLIALDQAKANLSSKDIQVEIVGEFPSEQEQLEVELSKDRVALYLSDVSNATFPKEFADCVVHIFPQIKSNEPIIASERGYHKKFDGYMRNAYNNVLASTKIGGQHILIDYVGLPIDEKNPTEYAYNSLHEKLKNLYQSGYEILESRIVSSPSIIRLHTSGMEKMVGLYIVNIRRNNQICE